MADDEREDRVFLRIDTTVDSIDEALAWFVQQMERYGIEHPAGGFEPFATYEPTDGDQSPEPTVGYQVWISSGIDDVQVDLERQDRS